jgi:hypothetical protein
MQQLMKESASFPLNPTPGQSGTPRRPGSSLCSKLQKTNNKFQESSNEQQGKLQKMLWSFPFDAWSLFVICLLSFGA